MLRYKTLGREDKRCKLYLKRLNIFAVLVSDNKHQCCKNVLHDNILSNLKILYRYQIAKKNKHLTNT